MPDQFSVTNDGSGQTNYRFRVNGQIEGGTSVDDSDAITEVRDGVYEAEGFVNGGIDTFTIHGPVVAFWHDGPAPSVTTGATAFPAYGDSVVGGGIEQQLQDAVEGQAEVVALALNQELLDQLTADSGS